MTELTDWSFDLYGHELERVAATLAAAGHAMDLVTMHADEADAHRMLYTGLDKEQRRIHRQLVAHGILGGPMLDPAADIARRVLVNCTPCGSSAGLYLLASEGRYLFVNCPDCQARYWLDTHCGQGRPDHVNEVPAWPV